MALKDWRKFESLSWKNKKINEILFINNVKDGGFISWKSGYCPVTYFQVMILRNSFDSKSGFKTKTQALAYAKAYMRKH